MPGDAAAASAIDSRTRHGCCDGRRRTRPSLRRLRRSRRGTSAGMSRAPCRNAHEGRYPCRAGYHAVRDIMPCGIPVPCGISCRAGYHGLTVPCGLLCWRPCHAGMVLRWPPCRMGYRAARKQYTPAARRPCVADVVRLPCEMHAPPRHQVHLRRHALQLPHLPPKRPRAPPGFLTKHAVQCTRAKPRGLAGRAARRRLQLPPKGPRPAAEV